MKKGFIALAVIALASSVFAQDAPKAEKAAKTFTLSGGVDAYYLSTESVVKSDAKNGEKYYQHSDYGTARSRPLFKVADGASEFNLEFEMIGNYGVQGDAIGGNNGAPISNDQTGGIKLRGMYFSSTVAGVDGLKLTGGLCPTLDLGMWEKDLSPGFTAAYSVGKLATISLAWYQVYEDKKNGLGGDKKDAQYFSGTALVAPIDGVQVNLMGSYEVVGKTASGLDKAPKGQLVRDGYAYMYGSWVKAKFGDIGLSGIAQVAGFDGYTPLSADNRHANRARGLGYALNVSPTYNLDKDTVVAVFATYISGDKGYTKKDESFWDNCLDAQGFGHKMILFEDCGACANLDATNASGARVRAKGLGQKYGYTLFGAWATTKVGIYTPTFAVAYGTLNTAPRSTADNSFYKTDLGVEFDLFNAFKISDATTLNFELAYLLSGDAYKAYSSKSAAIDLTQNHKVANASSVALGMTQKF